MIKKWAKDLKIYSFILYTHTQKWIDVLEFMTKCTGKSTLKIYCGTDQKTQKSRVIKERDIRLKEAF